MDGVLRKFEKIGRVLYKIPFLNFSANIRTEDNAMKKIGRIGKLMRAAPLLAAMAVFAPHAHATTHEVITDVIKQARLQEGDKSYFSFGVGYIAFNSAFCNSFKNNTAGDLTTRTPIGDFHQGFGTYVDNNGVTQFRSSHTIFKACDKEDTYTKAVAGVRRGKWAAELGYARARGFKQALDVAGITDYRYEETFPSWWSIGVALVRFHPIADKTEVFGRLGVHRYVYENTWDALGRGDPSRGINPDPNAQTIRAVDRGTNLYYGIGVEYTVDEDLTIRGEWERYGGKISGAGVVDAELQGFLLSAVFNLYH